MLLPPKMSDKILVVAVLLSIVQIGNAATSYFFSEQSSKADISAIQDKTAQVEVERMNRLVIATVMDARGIYGQTDLAGAAQFEVGMKRSLEELEARESIAKATLPPDIFAELRGAFVKITEFITFRRDFLRMCREVSLQACRAYSDNDANRANRKQLNAALDKVAATFSARAAASGAQMTVWKDRVGALEKVSVLTPIVLMIIAYLTLRFGVREPFGRVVESVRQLSNGNLQAEIYGETRRDEIGSIARSLAIFRDELRLAEAGRADTEAARAEADAHRARAQAEAEANRAATEANRLRAERERVAATEDAVRRERDLVSDSLGEAIARLSRKDLQYRLINQLPDAYGQLQVDFNFAMDAIERAISDVVASARAVAFGSGEIATASNDLSRRTGAQASNLEELTAALLEMSGKVTETASGAKVARDAVTLASETARDGEDIARKTTAAMKRIEHSSNQISDILSLINEISFQTNLLALNASVEAARAGDAGLGFSVVASEVRALAQRSATAAKEIEALIAQAAAEVADGGKLVMKSGEAFVAIQSAIDNGKTIVAQIAEAAEEQATGLKDINASIRQLETMTHQNAAMAEEATASSQSLSNESVKLADLTAAFTISSAPRGDARRSPGEGARAA